MCVICVSRKGVRQPSAQEIKNMFENNSDGAGYMYYKKGKVYIHKGFASLDDYLRDIKSHNFTKDDAVVYHFRISTQARQLTMTHPFALTSDKELLKELDVICKFGICHNGIIPLTSDNKELEYSDTALYIADYLSKYIKNDDTMFDEKFKNLVAKETFSKWAFMNSRGQIATIGDFIDVDGLLFSNTSYLEHKIKYYGLNPIFNPSYKSTKLKRVNKLFVSVLDKDNRKNYIDTDLYLTYYRRKDWSNILMNKYENIQKIKEDVYFYMLYLGDTKLKVFLEIYYDDGTKIDTDFIYDERYLSE